MKSGSRPALGPGRHPQGFTLIEILMAILLVGILAKLAIDQFTNFDVDARNAATKESLGILRQAIQKHYGMMRLRCGVTNKAFPALSSVSANNIADGGSVCNTTQVGSTTDRLFVAAGIPDNPWSDPGCTNAERKQVLASPPAANMTVGVYIDPDDLGFGLQCGWIYEVATGRIKAASDQNPNGAVDPNLWETAF